MAEVALDPQSGIRLSDFCADADAVLDRLENTGRPTVLTHDGRADAVVLPISVFQDLLAELEAWKDEVERRLRQRLDGA